MYRARTRALFAAVAGLFGLFACAVAEAGNVSIWTLGYYDAEAMYKTSQAPGFDKKQAALNAICDRIAGVWGMIILAGVPSPDAVQTIRAELNKRNPADEFDEVRGAFATCKDCSVSFGIIGSNLMKLIKQDRVRELTLKMERGRNPLKISICDFVMEADPKDFFLVAAARVGAVPSGDDTGRMQTLNRVGAELKRHIEHRRQEIKAINVILFLELSDGITTETAEKMLRESHATELLEEVTIVERGENTSPSPSDQSTPKTTWTYRNPKTNEQTRRHYIYVNKGGLYHSERIEQRRAAGEPIYATRAEEEANPFVVDDLAQVDNGDEWRVIGDTRPIYLQIITSPR